MMTLVREFMNKGKPLAIVVKGNPAYTTHPKNAAAALVFYENIRQLLVAKGYRVEFDEGDPYTLPMKGASVWIGHSRGIDRLRFAPKGVRIIALQTLSHGKRWTSREQEGMDPEHYKLSPIDLENLSSL